MKGRALLLAVVAAAIAMTQAATVNNFPYASCTKRPSSYSLSTVARLPSPNTFCFSVNVTVPENCTSYCCANADVRKILIDVNPECAVFNPNMNATINGVPTKAGAAFEPGVNGPNNSYVLRLTQLGLNLTNADGVEICVSLGPNSAGRGCLSLRDLCKSPAGSPSGTCAAALFDTKNDCCPVSQYTDRTPLPPSPPPPPPSPVVVPTTEPCTVCATLTLQEVSPSWYPFPIAFSEAQCSAWSQLVSEDFIALAESVNVTVGPTDPVVKCSGSELQVCGQLVDKEDGIKLQGLVDSSLPFWYSTVADPCKAYYRGPIRVAAKVDNGMDDSGCINSALSVTCDPAPVDFPKCKCITSPGATRFYASPYLEKSQGRENGTTLYCFRTFVASPRNPSSACGATTNLLKAEIFADDMRRRKIKAIGVTAGNSNVTRWMSPSWGSQGEETLKVSTLNWGDEQADGGRICLEMDSAWDIGSFCKTGPVQTCKIIFFDDSKNCCPLFDAST